MQLLLNQPFSELLRDEPDLPVDIIGDGLYKPISSLSQGKAASHVIPLLG